MTIHVVSKAIAKMVKVWYKARLHKVMIMAMLMIIILIYALKIRPPL